MIQLLKITGEAILLIVGGIELTETIREMKQQRTTT